MERRARLFGDLLAAVLIGAAALPAAAQDAGAMHGRYLELRETLERNDFGRPLALESSESAGGLKDEIYAVLDAPFALAAPALSSAGAWCDILILHLNVKRCLASGTPAHERLEVAIGRKYEQPADEAYQIGFRYELRARSSGYLQAVLHAASGPVRTRDYRILVEAVPLEGGRSFLHFAYSYEYGTAARLALQAYLHTLGRDKVGFTIVGRRADGTPRYIDGLRGVIERNAMRYFLALDAYLRSLPAAPAEQLELRLRTWFDSTERYATQLHELSAAEYLQMKRREARPAPPRRQDEPAPRGSAG